MTGNATESGQPVWSCVWCSAGGVSSGSGRGLGAEMTALPAPPLPQALASRQQRVTNRCGTTVAHHGPVEGSLLQDD